MFEDYPAGFARSAIPCFEGVLRTIEKSAIPFRASYVTTQLHRFIMDSYLLSLAVESPADVILDAGCGIGITAMAAKAMGYSSIRVVDIPDYRVTDFMDRDRYLALFGLRVEKCDLMEDPLPAPGASVDVVNCNDTIEHLLGSPRAFLEEAHRVLKPGGRIVISTPNSVSLRHRLAVVRGVTNYAGIQSFYDSPSPYRGHVREYTMSDLRFVLARAGFDVVRWVSYNNFFKDLYSWSNGVIRRRGISGPARPKQVLRRALWAATRVLPSLRDSLAVIGRKP
jgi:SAM-dependent methyltransferase